MTLTHPNNLLYLNLTYIGHATNLIEMDGVRILTDPLLRNRVAHLRRSHLITDLTPYQAVDAVLISHLHHDHCDLPSLRMLDTSVQMIVPIGAKTTFIRWGFKHVEEIAVGQTLTIRDLSLTATKANHAGFRPPLGPVTQPVGYLINGSRTLYFAGDTDIFPEMVDLPRDTNIALLPVWGWGPTLGEGHLNPYEAARALTLIQPQIAIPIHWGTFSPLGLHWLNMSFMRIPPQLFTQHAHELAPEVDIRILNPGETLMLPETQKPSDF